MRGAGEGGGRKGENLKISVFFRSTPKYLNFIFRDPPPQVTTKYFKIFQVLTSVFWKHFRSPLFGVENFQSPPKSPIPSRNL